MNCTGSVNKQKSTKLEVGDAVMEQGDLVQEVSAHSKLAGDPTPNDGINTQHQLAPALPHLPPPSGKQHVVCMVGKVPENIQRKKIPYVLTLPQASLHGTADPPFEDWHLWPLQAVERTIAPHSPGVSQCTDEEHARMEHLFNKLKDAANKGGAPAPIITLRFVSYTANQQAQPKGMGNSRKCSNISTVEGPSKAPAPPPTAHPSAAPKLSTRQAVIAATKAKAAGGGAGKSAAKTKAAGGEAARGEEGETAAGRSLRPRHGSLGGSSSNSSDTSSSRGPKQSKGSKASSKSSKAGSSEGSLPTQDQSEVEQWEKMVKDGDLCHICKDGGNLLLCDICGTGDCLHRCPWWRQLDVCACVCACSGAQELPKAL